MVADCSLSDRPPARQCRDGILQQLTALWYHSYAVRAKWAFQQQHQWHASYALEQQVHDRCTARATQAYDQLRWRHFYALWRAAAWALGSVRVTAVLDNPLIGSKRVSTT